jgi:flagellar biosynthesis protein FlhF
VTAPLGRRQAPRAAGARGLAERHVLDGFAPDLAQTLAAAADVAARGGLAAPEALAASLDRHLLGEVAGTPARVTAFIGPTGGGKTTTIAKLAARDVVDERRVALVMADTYRIGAAEQLGTYARLLGVPLAIARDGAELAATVASLGEHDRIYVDTSGFGGDPAAGDAVGALLAGAGPSVAVTAVVSATASETALAAAWRRLAPLAPSSCVITKLDEGGGIGTVCSWAAARALPPRWLGTGQRVPEDLRAAGGATLAEWLVAA